MKSWDGWNGLKTDELVDPDLRPWAPGSPHPIWVPEPPRLEGSELVWQAHEGLIGLHPRFPTADLLMEFLQLGDAPEAKIWAFAQRWGMLDSRPFARVAEFVMRPDFWPRPGHALPCVTNGWPTGEWRERI